MELNKKAFYKAYRKYFGVVRRGQVKGIDTILDASTSYNVTPEQLAYILATVYHETATKFRPIKEYGGVKYFDSMYDPVRGKNANRRNMAKRNGNIREGDGRKYFGRGFVQITWKRNYKRFEQYLKVPLVEQPNLALDLDTSVAILYIGMLGGVFTGKSLVRYISRDGKKDYYNARRVVNGMDKAGVIASHAKKFERCVNFAIDNIVEE